MTPRALKQIETLGFVLVGVLAIGALVASRAGAPGELVDFAVGACIAIALPTMWLNLCRRWRGN